MTHQLTKEDLRGCPFCGGLGELEEIESGCYGVGCQDCDFQLMNGSIGIGWHKSESDAVRVWNERNSDLCIQGLQDWTKKLQSSLDAANSRIAELEQGKCLHQIAEPAAQGLDAKAISEWLLARRSHLGSSRESAANWCERWGAKSWDNYTLLSKHFAAQAKQGSA